jgi:HAD superfamily hydrolase (TIGR01450 family)
MKISTIGRRLHLLNARLGINHAAPAELARTKKEINILTALPQVWAGQRSYKPEYPDEHLQGGLVSRESIIERYDTFLFDVFGTLISDAGPIPGANNFLKEAMANGKNVLLVTNVSKSSAEENFKELVKAGIKVDPQQVITAGQLFKYAAAENGLIGQPVLHIGNDSSRSYLEQAGLLPVEAENLDATADLRAVVVAALQSSSDPKALEDKVTKHLKSNKYIIPVILINPDKYVPKDNAARPIRAYELAANIARNTRQRFLFVGKPMSYMYTEALKRLSEMDKEPGRVLCVGDTLSTDIKGANEFGFDSLLLLTGTERLRFTFAYQLARAMKKTDAFPTWVLSGL